MSLTFREATEADLDRLVEIHQSAFPDGRGFEARIRNFAHNPLGSLHDLVVAEEGGRLVGHGFLFSLEAWFGGARVRIGGVASLGVAPEARRTGVGRAILAQLHDRARDLHQAMTLLYPFRSRFYMREGYSLVSPYVALEVAPGAIPTAWRNRPGVIRAATGDDRDALREIHEAEALRRTGWIARPLALWERRLLDERRRWFVLDRDGRSVGYIAWTLAQIEPHAPVEMTVDELAGLDDEARLRLLAFASDQKDQVSTVRLDVAADDPLTVALVDPDQDRRGTERIEHPLGTLAGAAMVRLVDLTAAIEGRGYAGEGSLDLELPDRVVHVEVDGGRGRLLPARGGRLIRVDPPTLAAVLYGSLAPSAAARLGWLWADDPATLRHADTLFRLPAFFTPDSF
jgi:predicted acetyltransferase